MKGEVVEVRHSGLEVLATLERLGAVTSTSLELPEDMPYEQYAALGVALSRAYRTVNWMLADWINFGERVYGEKYAQAVDETGLHPGTLMNYASIARRVPRERRVAGVAFGIHAEVASLPPKEQTEWLEKAKANDWKRDDLRAELRPQPKDLTPALGPMDIEDAARDLIKTAKKYGDRFIVERASFIQLTAALGEEL